VAAMLANTPEMVECHFGVPMTGGVLNTLNTRLDADAIAFMLNHGEARVLITDQEFAPTIEGALKKLGRPIEVIDVEDPEFQGGKRLGGMTYEALLEQGDAEFEWRWPEDEWQAISLNYTSGTTGDPKGVVYHHRGAYLNAVCNILTWGMPHTRCTCGRCRCSTATAGAFPGPWRRTPAPTSACERWKRRRSSS